MLIFWILLSKKNIFPIIFRQELRDENDELRLQVEGLINQVNTSVKRRPSHRKRQSGEKGVHRVGSVLSDYTKPTIIRRKKEGGSSEEESEDEMDQVDGGTRMSGDGKSIVDAGKHGIDWHMHCDICSLLTKYCFSSFLYS